MAACSFWVPVATKPRENDAVVDENKATQVAGSACVLMARTRWSAGCSVRSLLNDGKNAPHMQRSFEEKRPLCLCCASLYFLQADVCFSTRAKPQLLFTCCYPAAPMASKNDCDSG